MYKGIIFDMDGVIVDTEYFHFYENLNFLRKHGTRPISEHELEKTIGLSSHNFYRQLAQLLGGDITSDQAAKMFHRYLDFESPKPDYRKIFRSDIQKVLNLAKKADLKIGLASSSRMDTIDEVVSTCEIKNYFDTIVSGQQFKESKPNPEIYLTTAAKLQLSPANCIAVEDSFYGIKAAKKAGMTVVAYEENRLPIDQTKADYIEKDMQMIAQRLKYLLSKEKAEN